MYLTLPQKSAPHVPHLESRILKLLTLHRNGTLNMNTGQMPVLLKRWYAGSQAGAWEPVYQRTRRDDFR